MTGKTSRLIRYTSEELGRLLRDMLADARNSLFFTVSNGARIESPLGSADRPC
jgi:hypothetical protein